MIFFLSILFHSCLSIEIGPKALSPKEGYNSMVRYFDEGNISYFERSVIRTEDINYLGSKGHILEYLAKSDSELVYRALNIILMHQNENVDFDYQNSNGETALMIAVVRGDRTFTDKIVNENRFLRSLKTFRRISNLGDDSVNIHVNDLSVLASNESDEIDIVASFSITSDDNNKFNALRTDFKRMGDYLDEIKENGTVQAFTNLQEKLSGSKHLGFIHTMDTIDYSNQATLVSSILAANYNTVLGYALATFHNAPANTEEIRRDALIAIIDRMKSEVSYFSQDTILNLAVAYGDEKILRKLLNNKYLNKKLSYNGTVLHRCAQDIEATPEILNVLLSNSDVLSIINKRYEEDNNRTALMIAALNSGEDKNIDLVVSLLSFGANKDLLDLDGKEASQLVPEGILLGREVVVNGQTFSQTDSLALFIQNYSN